MLPTQAFWLCTLPLALLIQDDDSRRRSGRRDTLRWPTGLWPLGVAAGRTTPSLRKHARAALNTHPLRPTRVWLPMGCSTEDPSQAEKHRTALPCRLRSTAPRCPQVWGSERLATAPPSCPRSPPPATQPPDLGQSQTGLSPCWHQRPPQARSLGVLMAGEGLATPAATARASPVLAMSAVKEGIIALILGSAETGSDTADPGRAGESMLAHRY